MPKKWNILSKYPKDLKKQILQNRNLNSKKEQDAFFYPKISDYENLLEIPGIDKAKERIKKAIENQELIYVYGDYDVDGISACAIIYHGLKSLGAKILPYIPHREKEGYGLSKIGLDEIKDKGGSLVITVDNGIVAFAGADYAKKLNIDLIITDHHSLLDKKPQAYCIVHSLNMCGAGVAWCLMKELVDEKLARELLQFVVLGTISDLIPVVGLGRVFVKEGLKQLRQTKNPGLNALVLEAGINKKDLGSFEIGYIIGPRLNAAGRLEHALDALRLVCTKDALKAVRLAKLLCDINSKRQTLTSIAYQEAKLQIIQDKKIHFLQSSSWPSGIIGLVAGKIAEEYHTPTIALSVGESISKGSARSLNGLNIVETIRGVSDLLLDIGGHPGAAGFTIENSKIEEFIQRIESRINDSEIKNLDQTINIDALVNIKDLSFDQALMIQELEPFGVGNPNVILASKDVKVYDLRLLSLGKHLKLKAEGLDVIAFGMGQLKEDLKEGQKVNLAYNLEINKYNGRESLQLKLQDIQLKD